MGRKTSVWLADDLAERVRASGVPLGDLIRRGLDAAAPSPVEEMVRRAVRAEFEVRLGGVPLKVTADERMPPGIASLVSPPSEPGGKPSVTVVTGIAPEAAPSRAPGHGPGAPAVPSPARAAVRRASDFQVPPRCPHKGVRVTGGWCPECRADVRPGGRLPDDWTAPEGRSS